MSPTHSVSLKNLGLKFEKVRVDWLVGNVGHPNSGAPYLGMWSHYPGSLVWRARNLSIILATVLPLTFVSTSHFRVPFWSFPYRETTTRLTRWSFKRRQTASLAAVHNEKIAALPLFPIHWKWIISENLRLCFSQVCHQAWKIISMLSLLGFLPTCFSFGCFFTWMHIHFRVASRWNLSARRRLWWPFKNWYV